MSNYVQFCKARAAGNQISPAFVCLLLQICANSLQEVRGQLQEKVEYEIGEESYDVSIRIFRSADALSRTISPGFGGIYQCLQLLEAATWMKGDGKIVEAWHYLSRAVREEQECSNKLKPFLSVRKLG